MLKKDGPHTDALRSLVLICGILALMCLLYFVNP